jgi:ribosomal protein S8
MSLVNLAAVCSHLQNASKARLGLTSIPVSKLHVALMLSLQKQGFISSVTLGGPSPPTPVLLQRAPHRITQGQEEGKRDLVQDAFPTPSVAVADALTKAWEKQNPSLISKSAEQLEAESEARAKALRKESWGKSPEWSYKETVPSNPAQQRLWVGLKYWKNEPVLNKLRLVSKPTRRIWVGSEDLAKITRGRESAFVKGLTRTGECLFVTTDRGVMEARECVEKKVGGMVLCRVI